MSETIGIVVVATNAYFPLGVRFIRRFHHFYTGSRDIRYYFFSDIDPTHYLPDDMDVRYTSTHHDSWVDATNSKFTNIVSIDDDVDYLYYFDADTLVSRPFDEEWFLGDLVGGEHYGNRGYEAQGATAYPFERNDISSCYIPLDTDRDMMYYYGAFFGGRKDRVMDFCLELIKNQEKDREIPYEPGVNDESYINHYFHYNPPKVVFSKDFAFGISCKGGMGETRDANLDITQLVNDLKLHKGKLFNINKGHIIYE